MPKRSRKGPVNSPVRVVAPTSVKRGRSRRRRSLPHHDVESEVLERGVEHLLHHAVQAMDLVDEQHVALFEVREDGREIARALDGGAARRLDVRAQLVGHDGRERGLAEARRPREQDVVHHVAARLRGPDENGERLLDLRLAQVVAQALGAQAAVEREVVLGERRRHGARASVDERVVASPRARFEHEPFYFNAVVSHSRLSVPTARAAPPGFA